MFGEIFAMAGRIPPVGTLVGRAAELLIMEGPNFPSVEEGDKSGGNKLARVS